MSSRTRLGPWIMPDGRPLSLYLLENEGLTRDERHKGKGRKGKRAGQPREVREGWTKAMPRAAGPAGPSAGMATPSDAEAAEAAALARVGQRRRRRWLNDRLLRDMAGNLTAKDMEALFKPVPFGERSVVSAFTQATSREHMQLWELFRSVDMDRESRVLSKWEAHVRELAAARHPAAAPPAVRALAAWARVNARARHALKRAPHQLVEDIESQLLGFLDDQQHVECEAVAEGGAPAAAAVAAAVSGGAQLELDLEDGFQRLLAHGLAQFHSLASVTRQLPCGTRRVVVRRHRRTADEAATLPAQAVQRAAVPEQQAELEQSAVEGCTAEAGAEAPPLNISCADILLLLTDQPEAGLNLHVVESAFCHHSLETSLHDSAANLAPGIRLVSVQ